MVSGGARKGAGRKPAPEKIIVVSMRLPISIAEKLKKLGGRDWISKQMKSLD